MAVIKFKNVERVEVGTMECLLTPRQAAARLNCSQKTLTSHVKDGNLRYVNIGLGSKKPRRMFTDADISDFITRRTQRDAPCQFSNLKARRSTTSIFKSSGRGFMALRAAKADAKRKRLSEARAKSRKT